MNLFPSRITGIALALSLAACGQSSGIGTPVAVAPTQPDPLTSAPPTTAKCEVSGTETQPPAIKHVFLYLVENMDFDPVYGPGSTAEYLNKTLVPKGMLMRQLFGTAHASTGNYISLISGQAPNPAINGDCAVWADFRGTGTAANGQAIGQGCVFPTRVKHIGDELESAGLTWKAYGEDYNLEKRGGTTSGQTAQCIYPDIDANDNTNSTDASENYATRHNPFLFFHNVIDNKARCEAHTRDLEELRTDLKSAATTPNYNLIVANNCSNGHDASCQKLGPDGKVLPGGLAGVDGFLKEWVPLIMASPAYQDGGMIIIMGDENGFSSADACCGNDNPTNVGPNTATPGLFGLGGGRYGGVILSKFVAPGSVNDNKYNHYSILRSMENIFDTAGNGYLGFAGLDDPKMKAFGEDVYNCGG